MSQPAAVRTNPDALPGFVLSEPLLSGYDATEEQINREYEARYIDIHTRVDQRSYDEIAAEAERLVGERPFRTFGTRFCQAVEQDRKLVPWVLWACLERRHPTVTIQQAKELVRASMASGNPWMDGDQAFNDLWRAAKNLFFEPPKNAFAASADPTAAAST